MAATISKTETKKLIKKQRKRLKEIEQLERVHRSLSPDERVKVKSKRKVRKFLQSLLAEYVKENEATKKDDDGQKNETHNIENPKEIHSPKKQKEEEYIPLKKEETNIRADSQKNEQHELQPKNKGRNDNSVGKLSEVTVPPHGAASGDMSREVKENPRQLPKDQVSDESRAGKGSDVKVKVLQRVTAAPDPADGKPKEVKKKKNPKPSLASKQFKVTSLEGHSDLITAVVLHEKTLVTSSRDTTVKTWDVLTGEQKRNFGGHTNSVTCLIVLGVKDAQKSVSDWMDVEEPLVISGSFDCSLKMWSLDSGHLLKSIYTYNPVSQISYSSHLSLLVLGSDTGKLELWDLGNGEQQYSLHAYDTSVTGIKVADKQLHSSASDGTIKIYSMTDDRQLSCVFESENVLSTSGRHLTPRHVRSIELCEKGTLIGDDAKNIKVLNWKKNEASKIPNHHSDFSSTDAIRCHGDFFVASSYDLDSGLGYINVRSSRSLEYQATLDDKDTERILCLDVCTLSGGNLVIATGGVDLKVWEVLKQHTEANGDDVFHAEFREALADAAVDSEDDDDDDDDDDDEEDSMDESASSSESRKLGFQQEAEAWWWTSWCTVI